MPLYNPSSGGGGPETDPLAVHLTGNETVAGVKTFSSEPAAPSYKATGLTGAANATRYVGSTTNDVPSSGTFAVGDFVIAQDGQVFTCVVAGTPGSWTNPRDRAGLLTLTSGQETISRCNRLDSFTLLSGGLQLTYFTAHKSETSTQVRVISGNTGSATVTLARVGLYSIASNGAGTLVASIANDTTLLNSGTTAYTRSWSSSYAMVAGQRYALGLLVVASTAGSAIGIVQTGMSAELAIAPRLAGRFTGQTDLPGSYTDASLATTAGPCYGVVLP